MENDELLSLDEPVLSHTEKFTVYIKNSVAFPYFGQQYRKNNIGGKSGKKLGLPKCDSLEFADERFKLKALIQCKFWSRVRNFLPQS